MKPKRPMSEPSYSINGIDYWFEEMVVSHNGHGVYKLEIDHFRVGPNMVTRDETMIQIGTSAYVYPIYCKWLEDKEINKILLNEENT